jgi:hypothetical protein
MLPNGTLRLLEFWSIRGSTLNVQENSTKSKSTTNPQYGFLRL